jgi:hypothetical protein
VQKVRSAGRKIGKVAVEGVRAKVGQRAERAMSGERRVRCTGRRRK